METETVLTDANVENADCGSENKKIKTHFAKIVVGGTAEKPYFSILFFDSRDEEYHIGYGSFRLDYVFKWLSEEFEIIDEETLFERRAGKGMTVQKALKLVEKEYDRAKKLDWIRNPLAYALYKVWRLVEKESAKNGKV